MVTFRRSVAVAVLPALPGVLGTALTALHPGHTCADPGARRHDVAANVWALARPAPPGMAAGGAAPSPGTATGPGADRGGCAWAFDANVRPHPDESSFQHLWPDVAIAPGALVAVAWMANVQTASYHIFYSTSADGGATWSPPEQVDTGTGGGNSKFVDFDFTPAGIAVAVWENDGNGVVYLSKRDPASGGTPWTTPVPVSTAGTPPGPSSFRNPSLAVLDDDRYFVAWTDWREGVFYQVYGRGTWDGGTTWGPETRVSDGLGFEPVAGDPCLRVDPTPGQAPGDEVLYCVTNDWRGNVPGGRFPNVYFYRSTDGGASWTVGVRVNDIEPGFQQTSSHALVWLEGGTLTAGWLNSAGGGSHFHTNVSTDQGVTWSASVQVDPPSPGGAGTYSSIAGLGGWIFAGFGLYEGDWNTYFRASEDGGRTWVEDACRMDDAPPGVASTNAVVAAASATIVHGAWSDNRALGAGPWKIYTARGAREATGIEAFDVPAAVRSAASLVCAPNPSRVGLPVRITAGARAGDGGASRLGRDGGGLRLLIYDAAGRRLRRVAGIGSAAVWDGRDQRGRPLPAGVYWVQAAPAAGSGPPGATRIVRLR